MNVVPFAPQEPAAFTAGYPYQAFPPASFHNPPHGGPTPTISVSNLAPSQQNLGYHDGAGARMASAGASLSPLQQGGGGFQTSYSQAQSLPTSAPSPAQLPPQYAVAPQAHSQSASPQPRASPYEANHGQRQTTQTPPHKYPMAAPPLPQSPANQTRGNASPAPQNPQSPGSQSREQQRAQLLLDINLEMLTEVSRLQAEGRGGAITPAQQAQLKAQGQPSDLASDEFIQVMRRLQTNLAYLMPVAQNDVSKQQKGPPYMTPPPHMPQLQTKYDQLRELFPDWPGLDQRQAGNSGSPGRGPSANGTPAIA